MQRDLCKKKSSFICHRHPPISSHSHLSPFLWIRFVCVCRDYTLWQIAIKAILRRTWENWKGTSLVILFDICPVCNWNGWWWPILACFLTLSFSLTHDKLKDFYFQGFKYWQSFFIVASSLSFHISLSHTSSVPIHFLSFTHENENKKSFSIKNYEKKIQFQQENYIAWKKCCSHRSYPIECR